MTNFYYTQYYDERFLAWTPISKMFENKEDAIANGKKTKPNAKLRLVSYQEGGERLYFEIK